MRNQLNLNSTHETHIYSIYFHEVMTSVFILVVKSDHAIVNFKYNIFELLFKYLNITASEYEQIYEATCINIHDFIYCKRDFRIDELVPSLLITDYWI